MPLNHVGWGGNQVAALPSPKSVSRDHRHYASIPPQNQADLT